MFLGIVESLIVGAVELFLPACIQSHAAAATVASLLSSIKAFARTFGGGRNILATRTAI